MKTKKETSFFSPEMKMSDLVEINYRLLTVLSRLGMLAGFGEKTVAQVCTETGIDAGAFILICEMYSYQGYMPTDEALKSADPLSVLRYLHISHSFYIEDGFKALEQLMDVLVAPCADSQKKIILDFLDGYRSEVEKHFEYEETMFFPPERLYPNTPSQVGFILPAGTPPGSTWQVSLCTGLGGHGNKLLKGTRTVVMDAPLEVRGGEEG